MPRCMPRRSLRSTQQQILRRLSRRCCFMLPQCSLCLLPCIFGIVYILPKSMDASRANHESWWWSLKTKPIHYSAAIWRLSKRCHLTPQKVFQIHLSSLSHQDPALAQHISFFWCLRKCSFLIAEWACAAQYGAGQTYICCGTHGSAPQTTWSV